MSFFLPPFPTDYPKQWFVYQEIHDDDWHDEHEAEKKDESHGPIRHGCQTGIFAEVGKE